MAYESLLTVTPAISSSNGVQAFTVNAGFDTTLLLDASNTTLGNKLTDEVVKLIINTDPDSTGTGLSATTGATSINITFSGATSLPTPQVWPGQVVPGSTTYKSGVSATLGVYWPPSAGTASSLWNTVIYLSANSTTAVIDPTKTSTLDNFFYLTNSPDVNHQVRTTFGHSRLVSYNG